MRQLHEATFFGNDVDPRMVRLATMNLTLRGLDKVRILRRDALTRAPRPRGEGGVGVAGGGIRRHSGQSSVLRPLDKDRIVDDVKVGRTTQTELLFLQYMLNHLKEGGRCGVVVPEGVLFGSTGAHRELRRKFVENNVESVREVIATADFGSRDRFNRQRLPHGQPPGGRRVMRNHVVRNSWRQDRGCGPRSIPDRGDIQRSIRNLIHGQRSSAP